MLDAGERQAMRSLVGALPGAAAAGSPEPEGAYLVPLIRPDGSRLLTGAELDRCEEARSLGVEASAVSASGEPDDQLSVAEAARLSGVTSRYIRYMCRAWEDHQSQIEADLRGGKKPSRSYFVAHRGTRNQWIVTRGELAAFLERRNAPAVRVGFDLTLTTEKSLGVLALLGDTPPDARSSTRSRPGTTPDSPTWSITPPDARERGKPILARGLTIASFRHLTSAPSTRSHTTTTSSPTL